MGGRYGEGEPPVLLARVTAPALDGRANRAVIDALAAAFGVRRSCITLVSGESNRIKVVDIEGGDPALAAQLLSA